MTHITIASTLGSQPIAINGRTTRIPTNKLELLEPHATKLQVGADDICATLDDAGVSFTRVQIGVSPTPSAAVSFPAGDGEGGAEPGGLSASPIVDVLIGEASEGLTLAEQGITGPANALPPVEIEGETDPLVPAETFPGEAPAPPMPPEPPAEPTLLDQSIPALTAALENITDCALLDALIADEQAGKTRTGAIAALNARKAVLESQE